MEKSYTKRWFSIFYAVLLMVLVQPAAATKIARMSMAELKDAAQMVALVEVVSTEKTTLDFIQLQTSPTSKLIKHRVNVLTRIKGEKNKNINFLHLKGLSAGSKYLVFLSMQDDKAFSIINNQYGAFKVSVVSMNEGVIEAIRIPYSYISLPRSMQTEMGVTKKDETSEFKWVSLKTLTKFLMH